MRIILDRVEVPTACLIAPVSATRRGSCNYQVEELCGAACAGRFRKASWAIPTFYFLFYSHFTVVVWHLPVHITNPLIFCPITSACGRFVWSCISVSAGTPRRW